ncbi:23S rRNA (adenine1618-N6)-methyltransferase [Hymenobacter luteus]|uniref:Ribosomal RNA large subunit methyltransferase F n=2 Tax=Hymenobacter TaxID=89966 RepID=A0A7W9T2U9_9BACT|nr:MULTISPECIES: 23S rRNA (adenine(1618)-N(6))-methyltransferase RlmF [Hymenobacter]MBB4601602.1 23S rRNA (adenine1618-N6)-methyltransferase [Hymenobacter latericoloratus]MBB6059970.1 23S rRNA (adenine1618-N6)-methyltransferase [Hymenobacter luteus]
MHPRNPHAARYNFPELVQASPELAAFVIPNPTGDDSIDFANPAAVKALNRALLKQHYGVAHWDVPAGYLCPPIPGRADYLHYAADLLAADHAGVIPRDKSVQVLDVGVGANCVYPIIGTQVYGWRFVGSEVDAVALRAAKSMVAVNPVLAGRVDLRLQSHKENIFAGIVKPREEFDLVICNPPFHTSAADAAAGSRRKGRNLGYAKTKAPEPLLNFGGQSTELWCEGGEEGFLKRMVAQSVPLATQVLWFSSLISKKETLRSAHYFLGQTAATEVKVLDMTQGQKVSRVVAWTFQDEAQRQAWAQRRWKQGVGSGQ